MKKTSKRFAGAAFLCAVAIASATSIASAAEWRASPRYFPNGVVHIFSYGGKSINVAANWLGTRQTWSYNTTNNTPHVPTLKCSGSGQPLQGFYFAGANGPELNATAACPVGQSLEYGQGFLFN